MKTQARAAEDLLRWQQKDFAFLGGWSNYRNGNGIHSWAEGQRMAKRHFR
jgi:hypothetical protein